MRRSNRANGADRYRPSNTLDVSPVFDDLAGVEHKDIGDIQLWFAACLKYVASRGLPVTAENLARFDSPDNTIFHPLGMQFFIDKIETLNGGYSSLLVRRYDDTHGFRSYRIVFSSRLESGN